jgi:Tfp pilus assembly protein PilN
MPIVNLLPEDYRKRRAQQRANVLCIALFAVVMVGVLGAAIVSEQSTAHTQEVREQVDAEFSSAAQLINQLQTLESQRSVLLDKASSTAALMERVPRSYLLGFITNARPEAVWLDKIVLETDVNIGKTVTPRRVKARAMQAANFSPTSPVSSVTITLTGGAETDMEVARFIARLRLNPLVDSVELDHSRERKLEDRMVRSFKLVLRTVPGGDAMDAIDSYKPRPRDDGQVALGERTGGE